ncbi:unnamed protein product, partial [marine sediment metagenome]
MRNKKAFIGLLLNPLVLLALLVVLVILAFSFIPTFRLAIMPTIDFAGFTWTDSGTLYHHYTGYRTTSTCGERGSGSTSITKENEFVVLKANANSYAVKRYIETEITELDEVLIIYEGYASASCSESFGPSNSASIGASVVGSESGSIGVSESAI